MYKKYNSISVNYLSLYLQVTQLQNRIFKQSKKTYAFLIIGGKSLWTDLIWSRFIFSLFIHLVHGTPLSVAWPFATFVEYIIIALKN